jgi:hypothetical protein
VPAFGAVMDGERGLVEQAGEAAVEICVFGGGDVGLGLGPQRCATSAGSAPGLFSAQLDAQPAAPAAECLGGLQVDDLRKHQKSGTTACGIGMAGIPTKKEFGFSAQIASVSGPSAGVANCARRSTGTLAAAASKSR